MWLLSNGEKLILTVFRICPDAKTNAQAYKIPYVSKLYISKKGLYPINGE